MTMATAPRLSGAQAGAPPRPTAAQARELPRCIHHARVNRTDIVRPSACRRRRRTSLVVGTSCRTHASATSPISWRHIGQPWLRADHCVMQSWQNACVQGSVVSTFWAMQMWQSSTSSGCLASASGPAPLDASQRKGK